MKTSASKEPSKEFAYGYSAGSRNSVSPFYMMGYYIGFWMATMDKAMKEWQLK